MYIVFIDMTVLNDDRKKCARSKNGADESSNAVSRMPSDAFSRSEKGGARANLAMFRIPQKQSPEDDTHTSASVVDRCERKKVNFGSNASLKSDTSKHVARKAESSAAHSSTIYSHNLAIRNSVRHSWNEAAAPVHRPDTFRSSFSGNSSLNTARHRSDKSGTLAVHSQSAKPGSDPRRNADVRTNKQCLQNSAVANDDKITDTQLDPQESTPKLPEELIRAGWKLCWSKQRYRWYVFNVRTGTSSWDVPK